MILPPRRGASRSAAETRETVNQTASRGAIAKWDSATTASAIGRGHAGTRETLKLSALVLIGLLGSIAATTMIWGQIQERQRLELAWVTDDHNRAIEKGIADTLDAVQSQGRLMAAAPETDRAGFAAFAASLRLRHPGILHIVWRPRREPPSGGSVTDRFPISYQVPDGSDGLGRQETSDDRSPNPSPRSDIDTLIARAVASGRPVISARVPLDPTKARYGVELVVPVARGDDEPAATIGVVTALICLTDLTRAAISLLEPRGIELLLEDLSAPADQRFLDFYASRLGPAPSLDDGVWQGWSLADAPRRRLLMDVADRRWSVTASPAPSYRSAEGFLGGPWLILAGGLLLTASSALFIRSLRRQARMRLRAQQALRASEQKLRILFDQSPDIIMTVNRLGRIILVNRPWPKAPDESAVGHNSAKLLPKGLRKWYRKNLSEVFGSAEGRQLRYSETDSRYWDVRIVPLRRGDAVESAMVIATDATERRLLEAQAIRSARLATLGVLAASVAHEINNPNNAIQFNAVLLQRCLNDLLPILQRTLAGDGDVLVGGLPASQAIGELPEMVSGLLRNTRRIETIVAGLKRMTRHAPGEYGGRVDLGKVLEAAYSLLQHQIHKHSDDCELLLPETLPAIRGNGQQLEQVFINLLLNALQALADRKARVWVTAEADEASVRVSVVDQGRGISDEDLTRIFDPLFTTRPDQGGTGLGLSICRRIVENHGGDIAITSVPGVGTEVVVQLPIAGPPRDRADAPPDEPAP